MWLEKDFIATFSASEVLNMKVPSVILLLINCSSGMC